MQGTSDAGAGEAAAGTGTPPRPPRRALRRIVLLVLAVLAAGFLILQVIPYGRDHANPPVTEAVAWPDPATGDLVRKACYDCHSNETSWPWYSNIAPMSWMVYRDVAEGREALNFSTWDAGQPELDELLEVVAEGEMPPSQYTMLHPSAKLTEAQRAQLRAGFAQMYAGQAPAGFLEGSEGSEESSDGDEREEGEDEREGEEEAEESDSD